MKRVIVMAAVLAIVASACGGGSSGGGAGNEVGKGGLAPLKGGEERTVLVDYRHDEFTSAFLRYYPETVKVRPGDLVTFRQTWTGEPHSVTMGKVVDNMFEFGELFEKYQSEEEARAGGVTEETIAEVNATFTKIPGMLLEDSEIDYEVYQAGAQPCFVPDFDSVPAFSTPGDDGKQIPDVECPTAGEDQPRFNGRQGLYNSGFIAPEGKSANTFQVPIAADTEPGTYRYFCNYHWTSMSGSVEVVAKDADIPSQQDVSREGRKEIEEDAKLALERVEEAKEAKGGKVDDLSLPLAGREADEEFAVIINEFLPKNVKAEVGKPVTWTFDGIDHTVSFNVPKYFPIFTTKDGGEVFWEPKSYEPVGWDIPEPPPEPEVEGPPGSGPETPGRVVDVGKWDGKGGFHSSGALSPGDSFSVTFTKAGTYPFACVLHPQMVGTVEVAD